MNSQQEISEYASDVKTESDVTFAQRDLYPISEARHKLGGISHSNFYELVKAKKVRLTKIGRRSFVADAEIRRFIDSLQTEIAA